MTPLFQNCIPYYNNSESDLDLYSSDTLPFVKDALESSEEFNFTNDFLTDQIPAFIPEITQRLTLDANRFTSFNGMDQNFYKENTNTTAVQNNEEKISLFVASHVRTPLPEPVFINTTPFPMYTPPTFVVLEFGQMRKHQIQGLPVDFPMTEELEKRILNLQGVQKFSNAHFRKEIKEVIKELTILWPLFLPEDFVKIFKQDPETIRKWLSGNFYTQTT